MGTIIIKKGRGSIIAIQRRTSWCIHMYESGTPADIEEVCKERLVDMLSASLFLCPKQKG